MSVSPVACRKIRYRDEIAAKMALATAGGRSTRRPKDERGVYRCPSCRGWHLTSRKQEAGGEGMSRPGTTMDGVKIYSTGIVHCSVCAPVTMEAAEVEAAVNAQSPTGISTDWTVSDETAFADGIPHPAPCDKEPQARRHWLMVC